MDELISRQAAITQLSHNKNKGDDEWELAVENDIQTIWKLPSIQTEIIYCKDCRKHNKKIGFDENYHTVWKEDACPLASWRGKAQGHEFDYQYCVFGERRTG